MQSRLTINYRYLGFLKYYIFIYSYVIVDDKENKNKKQKAHHFNAECEAATHQFAKHFDSLLK